MLLKPVHPKKTIEKKEKRNDFDCLIV